MPRISRIYYFLSLKTTPGDVGMTRCILGANLEKILTPFEPKDLENNIETRHESL